MIRVQTFYIDGQPYVNGEWREWKPELNPKYVIPPKDESGEYKPDFSELLKDDNETFYGTYRVYSIIYYQVYEKETYNQYKHKGCWVHYTKRVEGWINPASTDCMNIGKGDNGVGYLHAKVYPKIFEIMGVPLPDRNDKNIKHRFALSTIIDHINLITGIAIPMWCATYRFNFEIAQSMITHYKDFASLIETFRIKYQKFTHSQYD